MADRGVHVAGPPGVGSPRLRLGPLPREDVEGGEGGGEADGAAAASC